MKVISKIIQHTSSLEKRITALKLIDIWLNKGDKKLRPDNIEIPKYSRQVAQNIIGFFLINNYLKEEFHFTPYSIISYINIGFAWLTKQTTTIQCSLILDGKNRCTDQAATKSKKTKHSVSKKNSDVIELD